MITIENLKFSYRHKQVFSGINLTLEEGKIYGLLGLNGVGKTTLLKIISGLLKSSDGKCSVDGHNPFSREPSFLKDIFFVPEDFMGSPIPVEVYAKNMGVLYPNFDIELFYKLMSMFEVNPNVKFTKMSHGQQKKSILSIAVALKTKLLLLDEPTNGLDIPSKTQFRKIISEASTPDNTIVISTHQVRDLENLIDPIIILDTKGILLNAPICKIAEELHFSIDPEKDDKALYCEPALGGYMKVSLNERKVETQVNIEALFNAVSNNKELIKELFSK